MRYVGQTSRAPILRYADHTQPLEQGLGARAVWIAGLRAAGRLPLMVLLEEVPADRDLTDRERSWTATLQQSGEADTNVAPPRAYRGRASIHDRSHDHRFGGVL